MKTELFQLMFYPADTHHFHWNLMPGPIQFYRHCTLTAIMYARSLLMRQESWKPIKQASSDAWFKARENRLTTSCFHRIDKRVKDFDGKFVLSVLSSPKSVPSTPCSYGSAHESVAKMRYCELKPSVHLHDCGFVVNPHFSFLGATPDAKVCCKGVTGILEVKCPYTARDMSISQAVAQVTGFLSY